MGQSTEMFSLDRRRFPRYPCSGEVEILQCGQRWGWGRVSDISRSGCYIETTHPLPTFSQVQLRLIIAGIFFEIWANVVSSDPMFGMGMDFMMVPAEQWEKLPLIIEKITDAGHSPAVQHAASQDEAQPHMEAALHYLKQAQMELQEAMHGREEHRAKALRSTENAMNEMNKACKQESSLEATDPVSVGRELALSHKVH
jgi:hypothetical protein